MLCQKPSQNPTMYKHLPTITCTIQISVHDMLTSALQGVHDVPVSMVGWELYHCDCQSTIQVNLPCWANTCPLPLTQHQHTVISLLAAGISDRQDLGLLPRSMTMTKSQQQYFELWLCLKGLVACRDKEAMSAVWSICNVPQCQSKSTLA